MDGRRLQLLQVQTRWRPNDPLGFRPLLPITIASLPATQKHFDWAAHVSCLDILDKYLSHDASTLLSINHSGFSIKY